MERIREAMTEPDALSVLAIAVMIAAALVYFLDVP